MNALRSYQKKVVVNFMLLVAVLLMPIMAWSQTIGKNHASFKVAEEAATPEAVPAELDAADPAEAAEAAAGVEAAEPAPAPAAETAPAPTGDTAPAADSEEH